MLTLVIGNKNYSSWSLRPASRAYLEAMLALPAMREWHAAACAETETLPQFEK